MEPNIEFSIYMDNNDNFIKNYSFSTSDTISFIKKTIFDDLTQTNSTLNSTENTTNNTIDLTYISERVFKEFGKLFFAKGLLPKTFDQYSLSQFTDGNRSYKFLATFVFDEQLTKQIKPSEETILTNDNFPKLKMLTKNNSDKSARSNSNPRPHSTIETQNKPRKKYSEKYSYSTTSNPDPKNFVMNDNDFPSLSSKKK